LDTGAIEAVARQARPPIMKAMRMARIVRDRFQPLSWISFVEFHPSTCAWTSKMEWFPTEQWKEAEQRAESFRIHAWTPP